MNLEASEMGNWYIKAIYFQILIWILWLCYVTWPVATETSKNAIKFFIVNKNTQIRRCLYLALGIFCCLERPLKTEDGWTLLSEVFEAKKGIIATAVGTWHVIYRGKKWYYYSPCFSSSVWRRREAVVEAVSMYFFFEASWEAISTWQSYQLPRYLLLYLLFLKWQRLRDSYSMLNCNSVSSLKDPHIPHLFHFAVVADAGHDKEEKLANEQSVWTNHKRKTFDLSCWHFKAPFFFIYKHFFVFIYNLEC